MRRSLWVCVLGLVAAAALLAACPRSSSSPAQEVPVEINWPDAAPLPQPARAEQR